MTRLSTTVIPAKAGIHSSGSAYAPMDSGLRRNDEVVETWGGVV